MLFFIVMRLLLSSSQIEECNKSLRFVAGHADLEEVLSGDFSSNGQRDAPFDGGFHIIGRAPLQRVSWTVIGLMDMGTMGILLPQKGPRWKMFR